MILFFFLPFALPQPPAAVGPSWSSLLIRSLTSYAVRGMYSPSSPPDWFFFAHMTWIHVWDLS